MKIRINYKSITYLLEITRKITVIRGNSGTGKSKLMDLLKKSRTPNLRVDVNSPLPIIVFNNEIEENWKNILENKKDNIIFMDEDENYIETGEFASYVKRSQNYFVIITRSKMSQLPISSDAVKEIISEDKKYNIVTNVYRPAKTYFKPGTILLEDSKSGYKFMKSLFNNCVTSKGKSNIAKTIVKGSYKDKNILVIADGEAFGPEIEQLMLLKKDKKYGNLKIELPYSFEYLLLHSPLLKHRCGDHLTNTQKYAGCEFNSWEQYYEYFIKQITENTPAQYTKATISKCYIENCCCQTQPCELKIDNNINKTQFIEEYFDHIDFSLLQKQNDSNLPTGEDDNNKEENNNNQEQKQLNWI